MLFLNQLNKKIKILTVYFKFLNFCQQKAGTESWYGFTKVLNRIRVQWNEWIWIRAAQHSVKRITKIFNNVEVPLDHLDDGSPPAAGLLVAGSGKHLYTYIETTSKNVKCCGSVTFWYESGSRDPNQWLTDPDPAFFVSGWQDANKKKLFKEVFGSLLFQSTFT